MKILNAEQTKQFKQKHGISGGPRGPGRGPKFDYSRLAIGESFLAPQGMLDRRMSRPYPTPKQHREGIRASIRQYNDHGLVGYICTRIA